MSYLSFKSFFNSYMFFIFIFFKRNIYIILNKNLLLTLKKNYFSFESLIKKFFIIEYSLF